MLTTPKTGSSRKRQSYHIQLILLQKLAMTQAFIRKRTRTLTLVLVLIVTVSSLLTGCSSRQAMIIPDLSMAPTLQKGEKVTANFRAYRINDPQIGDLAIFIPRNTQDLSWVFRVAAGPGDTLSYKGGALQRNGETLSPPTPYEGQTFRSPKMQTKDLKIDFPYTLREREYFFLSDNPNHDQDSRYWGPIARSEIVGKLTNY